MILFLLACTLPELPTVPAHQCHEQALNWAVDRCSHPDARIELVDDWAICRCPPVTVTERDKR